MNLFQQACKAFPYHNCSSRLTTQRLRAKYIKALMYLGNKWILHRSNHVTRG